MDIGAAEITDWHVNGNGWSAIGYHFVIRRDGTVEKGRDTDNDGDVFDEVGAHAKGFNKNSIGICLVGGMNGFNFTRAQMMALDTLIDTINHIHADIEWLGHCDLPGVDKQCPQFDVKAWRGE
jgi:N-acetyl-anhydromuramyl-L-alanine amidase AmpD